MKKSAFLEGTIIATFAIVFSKILGVLYVIPFYALIGSLGSALYSYAYNIYVIFLNISSAGLPVGISKLVSEYDTLGYKEAKVRAYKYSIRAIMFVSVISFILMFIFTPQIVNLIIGNKVGGNSIESIVKVIRFVSISILVIPYLSVTRGYLQGHKYISPSSISQMIEQFVRILIVILGTFLVIKVFDGGVTNAVSIAVLGSFFGGLVAITYILIKINDNKKALSFDKEYAKDNISTKEIIKKIFAYSIPFVIINVTINFFNITDMTLIIRTLSSLGFSGEDAEFISGAMTTWGYKLNMIVNALATGMTISLIPNIVSAWTKKDKRTVNKIFNQAMRIVVFVSLPLVIGLSIFSEATWNLFYGVNMYGPVIFKISILTAAFCNVYLIFLQTAQSIGEYKTVYAAVILGFSMNAIFDVPFMLICNNIGLPPYYGATFATMLGYIVSISIIFIKFKKLDCFELKSSFKTFVRIILSTIATAIILIITKIFIPYNFLSRFYTLLYLIIVVCIGMIVYLFLTYKLKVISSVFGKDYIDKMKNKLTKKSKEVNDDN